MMSIATIRSVLVLGATSPYPVSDTSNVCKGAAIGTEGRSAHESLPESDQCWQCPAALWPKVPECSKAPHMEVWQQRKSTSVRAHLQWPWWSWQSGQLQHTGQPRMPPSDHCYLQACYCYGCWSQHRNACNSGLTAWPALYILCATCMACMTGLDGHYREAAQGLPQVLA